MFADSNPALKRIKLAQTVMQGSPKDSEYDDSEIMKEQLKAMQKAKGK